MLFRSAPLLQIVSNLFVMSETEAVASTSGLCNDATGEAKVEFVSTTSLIH